MILKIDVLPAPLRPMMPHRSPSSTVKVMFLKSWVAPKETPTFETERTVTRRRQKIRKAPAARRARLEDKRRPSGEAELLQHEGLVKLFPALPHDAVPQSIHNEAVERDGLASRRRRPERSGMRSRCMPSERYTVPLDQLIF